MSQAVAFMTYLCACLCVCNAVLQLSRQKIGCEISVMCTVMLQVALGQYEIFKVL